MIITTSRSRTSTVLLMVGGGTLVATAVAYLAMARLKGKSLQRIHALCTTGHAVQWDKGYPVLLPIAVVALPAVALTAAVAVIWLRRPGRRLPLTIALLAVGGLLTLFGLLYFSDYLTYPGGEQGTSDGPCGEGLRYPEGRQPFVGLALKATREALPEIAEGSG